MLTYADVCWYETQEEVERIALERMLTYADVRPRMLAGDARGGGAHRIRAHEREQNVAVAAVGSQKARRQARRGKRGGVRYSLYLLCKYKSTNTDTPEEWQYSPHS